MSGAKGGGRMTNREKINALCDEELANWLMWNFICFSDGCRMCPVEDCDGPKSCDLNECVKTITNWLKKEAEEK